MAEGRLAASATSATSAATPASASATPAATPATPAATSATPPPPPPPSATSATPASATPPATSATPATPPPPSAPVNTAWPVLSGIARDGQTLTTTERHLDGNGADHLRLRLAPLRLERKQLRDDRQRHELLLRRGLA